MSRLADSTQSKNWMQAEKDIVVRRRAVANSRPPEKRLTLAEEAVVRRHHERRILRLVTRCGFPGKLGATAMTFFKRFFLTRSVLAHNPAVIAGCALYTAAKVEEIPIHIDFLIERIDTVLNGIRDTKANPLGDKAVDSADGTCSRITAEMVLDEELKFLNAINFHLICFHPHRSLLIIKKRLADDPSLPSLVDTDESTKQPANDENQKSSGTLEEAQNRNSERRVLDVLMKRAVRVIDRQIFLSDAMFSYPPGLIALSAVSCAADYLEEESEFPPDVFEARKVCDCLDGVLRDDPRREQLRLLTKWVKRMQEGAVSPDDAVRAAEIRRRALCDKENDPTSEEFKKRCRQEEEEREAKRRKKAQEAQRASEERARKILG